METFAKAGGYILGFRIDPQDRIDEVFQEVQSLYQIYSVGPNFGVDFTLESEAADIEQLLQPKVTEDTELLDDTEDTHAIAAYYSETNNTANDEDNRFENILVDPRLGLAVESLADGLTIDQLWRVI